MTHRELLQERVVRLMVARETDLALRILRPRVSPATFAHVLVATRELAAQPRLPQSSASAGVEARAAEVLKGFLDALEIRLGSGAFRGVLEALAADEGGAS